MNNTSLKPVTKVVLRNVLEQCYDNERSMKKRDKMSRKFFPCNSFSVILIKKSPHFKLLIYLARLHFTLQLHQSIKNKAKTLIELAIVDESTNMHALCAQFEKDFLKPEIYDRYSK